MHKGRYLIGAILAIGKGIWRMHYIIIRCIHEVLGGLKQRSLSKLGYRHLAEQDRPGRAVFEGTNCENCHT